MLTAERELRDHLVCLLLLEVKCSMEQKDSVAYKGRHGFYKSKKKEPHKEIW